MAGAAQQHWDVLPRTGLASDPLVESFNGRSRDELLNVEERVVASGIRCKSAGVVPASWSGYAVALTV